MSYPKILLACPTSNVKNYCQDEWLNWIKQLTYSNLDILIVDNSLTDSNYNYLNKLKWLRVIKYKPQKKEGLRHIILKSTQIIGNYVLDNDYDYWFSLESDMFCPLNTLEYLIALNIQIIGLPYFHFEKEYTTLMISDRYNISNISFADYPHPLKSFLLCNGDLKQVYQSGLGCLLINRSVLKKIPIRLENKNDKFKFDIGFPDYFFHLDCLAHKIPVYIDTKYFCIHKNNLTRWNKIRKDVKI